MGTIGRLTSEGDLLVSGEINERLPVVTNGLVAHYPFDGKGGAFDGVGGNQTTQRVENGVNLIEAMSMNWRDPKSWYSYSGMIWDEEKQALKVVGYHNTWLKTPVIIDPTKKYQIMYEVMIEERSIYGSGEGSLYLGGYSLNKDGARVTRNYDYTVASSARPPLGEWTTFRLTRTGTEIASSGTSYTFDTVKGWKGDNNLDTAPTDLIVYHYHMGGLFNYSSGGVMYVRNLSIVVVNDDTSNTTLTDEGIAVEDTTTNILENGMFENNTVGETLSLTMWGGNVTTAIYTNDVPHSLKGLSVRMDCTAGSSGNGGYFNTHYPITIVEGKTYTYSFYIKAKKKETISGHIMSLNRESDNKYLVQPNITVTEEWQRFSHTVKIGVGEGGLYRTRHIIYTPNTIWITGLQLEEKPFPTSFVDGSRTIKGIIDIPFKRLTDYTVFGKFLPRSPAKNSSSYDTTAIYSAMLKIYDSVKLGGLSYRFWLSGTSSSPYLSPTEYYNTSTSSGNIHKTYELEANKPIYYALRKSGAEAKIKVFQNGIWKAEHIMNVPADAGMDKITIGDTTIWNGVHSDMSIYNRSLTDDELNKLVGSKMSFSQLGDLKAKVSEKPSSIPNGSIYFPLNENGEDYHKTIKPRENTLVYEDGVAWIGESTTNLYNGDSSNLGSGVTTVKENGWDKVTIETINVYGRRYKANLSDLVNGNTYTGSMKVYNPTDKLLKVQIDWCDAGYTFYDIQPKETKIISVTSSRATYDTTYRFLDVALQTSSVANSFWVKDVQIEHKNYRTPYVNGTRPYTRLNYYSQELTKNEYKDFTFMMWVKYMGQSSWQLSGDWSTWYFGAYGNSYFRFSWVENSANTGNTSQQRAIETSGYTIPKGKWIHVCVSVKENEFIDIYADGVRYRNWKGAFLLTTPMDIFELNSLNQTSTSYPLNAYVKDIMFMPRALTLEEVKEIYNTKMRDKDKLQIQGQIREGVIL